MFPSGAVLLQRIMFLPVMVLSLTVHEWAHAYSAFRLGDDTAARQGRLTLNPLPHIDPFGTILCPLMGVPFGWAKPVPITPSRFRRDVSMRTGVMITSAAGPVSNLILAITCSVVYGLCLRFGVLGESRSGLDELLLTAVATNLSLFVFNFLPIPPLDGSRIADGLMPYRFRAQWDELTRYSWIALLVVILVGGPLLSVPISWLFDHLRSLIFAIAG
jgi:Zn-dependent protease